MKKTVILLICLFSLLISAKADNEKVISFNELPQKAQTFIKQYFPEIPIALAKVETDLFDKEYKVIFTDGQNVTFDKNGKWEEVECRLREVPAGIVPKQILEYVSRKYPEAKIVEINRDSHEYEIKLNDSTELSFNKSFKLTDIDY